MKPDSYMPLFIGDWLKDTGHLDATCQGAYFLLCIHHWGKPGVPSDNDSLQSLMRVKPSDFARVRGTLKSFFVEEKGLWINPRCTKQYEKVCVQYEKTVESSKLGVQKRKELGQIPSEPEDNPSDEPSVDRGLIASSTQSKSKSNLSKERVAEASAVSEFRKLWSEEFPKHHGDQKYVHQGAKDALAEKKILSAMTPAEGVSLAVRAWGRPELFNCKFAVTISGFASKINEIRQELSVQKKLTPFEIERIIQAKKTEAANLKNRFCNESAMSTTWSNEKARLECAKLFSEIKQLNHQLASMA